MISGDDGDGGGEIGDGSDDGDGGDEPNGDHDDDDRTKMSMY